MFESSEIPDHRPFDQSSDPSGSQTIKHDRLGDLSRHNAVIMRGRSAEAYAYCETQPLYIHLSVTGRCQARCQGCINIAFNSGTGGDNARNTGLFKDTDPVRDGRCIVNLIRANNGETAAVCLYGGEPLLAADRIQALMENIDSAGLPHTVRYMLYTNGELLEKSLRTFPDVMRRIWLYSVSIDGTKSQHERIRRGTDLNHIHAGLAAIKDIRRGRVLMWSTLREEQSLRDCFEEFNYLHDMGLVDQFFWHWAESTTPFLNLLKYAVTYEKDLQHIMDAYTATLKRGTVLPITHINELLLYLLSGKKRNSTACGVEQNGNYDIVDGRIHSCADLPLQYAIGTIGADGTPDITAPDLSWLTLYKKDLGCNRCGVHSYCGGRCPVQAVTGSTERLRQYCQLMRLHVGVVNDYADEIAALLAEQGLTAQDLYDGSAFYVQFTDGTP